jgi:hypothetical protein
MKRDKAMVEALGYDLGKHFIDVDLIRGVLYRDR